MIAWLRKRRSAIRDFQVPAIGSCQNRCGARSPKRRGSCHGQEIHERRCCAAGRHRIQFTFKFEGVRYRPTLLITPTEANLRRAREQLAGIKARIAAGTFSFAEEFPDYVHLKTVPKSGSPAHLRSGVR